MSRLTKGTGGRYVAPLPARELTAHSADGARLHVEVHGAEKDPAIVLSHGWTCATAFWGPVTRDLVAAGYRVVLYDQRGHGRTPAARPEAYTPATLSDDLVAVLGETLEPGERAVLGGHSMGGMTLMAAADRPELHEHAAALLLCSTGGRNLAQESTVFPFRSAAARRRSHRLLLTAKAPLGPSTPLTRRALKYATMGRRSDAAQVEACARLVHACPVKVRGAWGRVLTQLDVVAKLPKLTVPAAVLVGTADRMTPTVHARELADALPQPAGFHALEGLGHMTPIESPETVAEVLRGLAAKHLDANPPMHSTGSRTVSGTEKESA